jgi:hypothetical protein
MSKSLRMYNIPNLDRLHLNCSVPSMYENFYHVFHFRYCKTKRFALYHGNFEPPQNSSKDTRMTPWRTPPEATPGGPPWRTPPEDTPRGHPQRTPPEATPGGYPRRTPPEDTFRGHSQRTPPEDTPRGHPRRTPPEDTPGGNPREQFRRTYWKTPWSPPGRPPWLSS